MSPNFPRGHSLQGTRGGPNCGGHHDRQHRRGTARPGRGTGLIRHGRVDSTASGGIGRRAGGPVLPAASGSFLDSGRRHDVLVGLAAFVALVAFQVRLIIRSRFPGLRAAEALGTQRPVFSAAFRQHLRRPGRDIGQQLRRLPVAYRRSVLHRHRVFHRRVRRHHRQDRDRAAGGHRADDHRPDHPRARHQGHRGCGKARPGRQDALTPCTKPRRAPRAFNDGGNNSTAEAAV